MKITRARQSISVNFIKKTVASRNFSIGKDEICICGSKEFTIGTDIKNKGTLLDVSSQYREASHLLKHPRNLNQLR